MSHETVDRVPSPSEAGTLDQVYQRLGALHATLAEADRIDDGLRRRTLDRLMDILELIEEAPRQARPLT